MRDRHGDAPWPKGPASSLRTQGPITTGVCGRTKAVEQLFPGRQAAAYGSLLSQGRRIEIARRTGHSGVPRPTGKIRFGKTEVICRSVKSLLKKRFLLSLTPNQLQTTVILSRHEGRFADVSNAGRDAVDAGGFLDEESCLRTAKPWGPGTPTLVSSLRDAIPADDGGLQARYTRATTEEPLKPLRRKCRVIPVNLW
jgi:hypothetical protein